jgi:hypothetical protein
MHIEAHGLVYDATAAAANRRVAFFSSLCSLASGSILAAFEVGSAKHAVDSTIGICRSRDGGATWQSLDHSFATAFAGVPGSLGGAEIVAASPGRLQLWTTWFDRSQPERPLFDPVTEGILRTKLLSATSEDEGDSWSDWREVPTPGLTGCATTGPIIAWPDGTRGFAFESFKELDDPRPARHAAWLMTSRDAGRSWDAPLKVGDDPSGNVYYWDQRLCPTTHRGEFVALFWTHDRALKRDLPVHLRWARIDNHQIVGHPIQPTTIPGQIAAPLVLDDHRLLAFVVDRAGPCTMKLWRSPDAGRTWPADECLVVYTHDEQSAVGRPHEQIDFAQYWEDMGKWSFGHPAIRRLGPNHVLLVYYAGVPDRMSIHWARVKID